jgi:hypothetical protein
MSDTTRSDQTRGDETRTDDGTIDLRDDQDPRQESRQDPRHDPLDTSTPVQQLDPSAAERGDQGLSTADLVERGNGSRGGDAQSGQDATSGQDERSTPLISDGDTYLQRWQTVQAGFVDDPRTAVQHADSLVAEVIQRIAQSFADERDQLEKQWSGGENVGTEELRVQLQRYRSFFTRLLHT